MANNIEKEVIARLKGSGINATSLKQMAKAVAAIGGLGVSIHDTFPEGIINPDAISIKGSIPISKPEIIASILKKNPRIFDVRVFPRGIPIPDHLRLHIGIK